MPKGDAVVPVAPLEGPAGHERNDNEREQGMRIRAVDRELRRIAEGERDEVVDVRTDAQHRPPPGRLGPETAAQDRFADGGSNGGVGKRVHTGKQAG